MNAVWRRVVWRTSACALIALMGAVAGMAAADAGPSPTSPTMPVQTVPLEFKDVPFAFFHVGIQVAERAAPFEKEPATKSKNVLRGTLEWGKSGSATNPPAFLWDRGAGRLYVDQNGNLDLTDDPAGCFVCASGRGSSYQTFTNVHVPIATKAGVRSTALDLSLYGGFGSPLYAFAGIRSLWLGKATFDGREWQVGIFDSPSEQGAGGASRRLLLRPWAEREQSFQVGDGAASVFTFATNVFVNGRAYKLVATSTGARGQGGINLEFKEHQRALGELRLDGQFIQRLALEGPSGLVLLEQPGSAAKVPLGRYTVESVRLRQGGVEAIRTSPTTAAGVAVSETGSGALAVGGPLTNSVSINRRGRTLVFNYQLLGAGGETYRLYRPGQARQPPEFAIFRGETKIWSDRFEFG